jgi:hypothetical protein
MQKACQVSRKAINRESIGARRICKVRTKRRVDQIQAGSRSGELIEQVLKLRAIGIIGGDAKQGFL